MSRDDRAPLEPMALTNVRLIDPAAGAETKGGLLIRDGKIADLGPGLFASGVPEGVRGVDGGGACLGPGLVDIRVHACEPGEEHKETIDTAAQGALAGGVTTMVVLPDTDPVIDDAALVEFVQRRARQVKKANVHCYGAVTLGLEGKELCEFGMLSEAGAVAFTDGGKAVASAITMRRALSYARTFDALIVQHPLEPSLSMGAMNEGEIATRLGLPGIPVEAEAIMLERDMRLVELTGGRYHAAQISCAESVEIVRRAKKKGLRVTCDTAPPYFCLNETSVGDYRTFAKLMPPLRSEMDRRAIVEGLRDGTVDVICSDHWPQDQDSKRQPFIQALPGIVGLETLLPLSLELVHNRFLSLPALFQRLALAPAKLMKLPGGRLEKGAPADLVLFDPDRPRRIDVSSFRSKCKNSPFDERPVQGQVLATFVAGRALFADKEAPKALAA
ncbi:MAG: dihydroorotase [Reyranellaceae bacterium]